MSSRVDVRVENDPDMWIAINNADSDESPYEKSYDTQSSLNQGKEHEDESDDDLSYIANYVQLQAHNKRLYSRKASLQKKIQQEE